MMKKFKEPQENTKKRFMMQVAKNTQREEDVRAVNGNEADQELTNSYDIDLCVLTSHRWCELVRQGVPARGQER